MSLPFYIATALPITLLLFLVNVWWDRHWKLQNLPTPVCLVFGFMTLALSFSKSDPIPTHRLVPLSYGATKSSSSKTSKAINGGLGSTNAVELSRSKLLGATQKS